MDNDAFNNIIGRTFDSSGPRDILTVDQAKENIIDYLWEREMDDFIECVKDGGEPTDHIFWDCLVATTHDPHRWLDDNNLNAD